MVVLYLVSSCIHLDGIGLPRVLSGDSPHYLAVVNSLIEDYDFDVSNNYAQAAAGDWDLGWRFRGVSLDHHVDRDRRGRELSTHSPFLPLLLFPLAWPFRGTRWVEPVCVTATLLVSLIGVAAAARLLGSSSEPNGDYPRNERQDLGHNSLSYAKETHGQTLKPAPFLEWYVLLALATPLWCYSRDLWTEPWIMALWIGILLSRRLEILSAFSVLATLIKYPFAVVPISMGAVALWRREYRRGLVLISSGVIGLAVASAVIQYLFRDVDHFSWFHSGQHLGFGLPFNGIIGLLLGPENGLLWFFPFLFWGLWEFRRGGELYLPAAMFFLMHAAYQDWQGGTGFSARYLVPMLPIMVKAVRDSRPSGSAFKIAVIYSLLWGMLAGFFPALVYDRTPWGVATHIWTKL